MAVAAILIDLDGTLWDSAQWYAALLAPTDTTERTRLTRGLRDPAGGLRAAQLLSERYSAGAFARACDDAAASLAVYQDAVAVLGRLQQKVSLGVVTNLPGWIARPMLKAQGLLDHFSVIQTARRGVPPKPHPAGVERAVAVLDVPPGAAVYIGDTGADRIAAEAAGVAFIWAGWGYDQVADDYIAAERWTDVEALL